MNDDLANTRTPKKLAATTNVKLVSLLPLLTDDSGGSTMSNLISKSGARAREQGDSLMNLPSISEATDLGNLFEKKNILVLTVVLEL